MQVALTLEDGCAPPRLRRRRDHARHTWHRPPFVQMPVGSRLPGSRPIRPSGDPGIAVIPAIPVREN